MAASTRPLTLGEILDRTVQLYRRNFLMLAGTAAPAAALIAVITGAVVLVMSSQLMPIFGRVGSASPPGSAPQPTPGDMLAIGLAVVGFLFVGLPLILGVFSMAQAALSYAATQINRGQSITMRASYGYAFRHFWRHVGILFLQGLLAGFVPYCVFGAIVVAGSILSALLAKSGAGAVLAPLIVILMVTLFIGLIVVCVLIWLRVSLAYSVSAAEDRKAWPSLKRSNLLSKGTRGRIFVMFLLVFVLTMAISLVLTIPLEIVIALLTPKSTSPGQLPAKMIYLVQLTTLGVGFLVRIFVMPIYVTALVLFYTDQRTRLEGYDIEQLMTQAGWNELAAPLPIEIAPPESPPLPSNVEGTKA